MRQNPGWSIVTEHICFAEQLGANCAAAYTVATVCSLQGATVRCKAVKALKAVVQASRQVLGLDEVQDGVSHALQVLPSLDTGAVH